MTQARKRRGRKSELVLARWLQTWFPDARAVNSGASGADLLGTPGLAVEVKARKDFNPLAWLRQSRRNAGRMLPIVVVRCNGQGTERPGEWLVMLSLDDFMELWADNERDT